MWQNHTTSDVSRMSVIFTEFTYFPRDVCLTHTSLHSTKLQLILRYVHHFKREDQGGHLKEVQQGQGEKGMSSEIIQIILAK